MSQSTVLLVEDDESLREALSTTLTMAGYHTVEAENGKSALASIQHNQPDIIISDVNMDGMDGNEFLKAIRMKSRDIPFLLMTAFGSVSGAVDAMRQGATDYLQKPFTPELMLNLIHRYIKVDTSTNEPIVADPKSQQLFQMAHKVANTDASVLLTGPSGAGKEVMAKYIHKHSPRCEAPFVAINCAAIPENMLEATLFGYEKGAFTGAYQSSSGKFEQAQNGTILLDEISEMDLGLQAKLLRVLQEKEVERLGAKKNIQLNVRVLATSNRDLTQEVKLGKFREDLFYRLNVFPLQCLALKERPLDIAPIAEFVLDKLANQLGQKTPKISNEAMMRIKRHGWPGNVRELQNVMQRALIMHHDEYIQIGDLHIDDNQPNTFMPKSNHSHDAQDKLGKSVQSHEFQVIIDALEQNGGNRGIVAKVLGVSPRTLRYKLAKMREAGLEVA